MSKFKTTKVSLLLAAVVVLASPGCGEILGPNFPVIASPRVIITTPSSPASDKITIRFQLIDREKESGDVTIEYSTDGAQTFTTATLTATSQASGLVSEWHPGITHSVQWDSVTDAVGISGDAQVCIKATPSDASNPSGTADITGTFTVDNIAYNQAPTATVSTPAGVQSGNMQITYTLTDTEGDTCSILVEFSIDGGAYQTASMGPAGDGLSGLPSSPGGTSHTFLWDSRADNVGPLAQQDNVRVRITPGDFHTGTAVATNPFSVNNSVPNNPPTVSITSGPANGSTIYTDSVTFVWSGNDTDGSISGYYYSFDRSPPDVWRTSTSVTSGILAEESHTFRVIAMDDEGAFSTVASRTFTVSTGFIQANFSASPVSGVVPLSVQFIDSSTSTSGITSWSWSFGDGETSTAQNPSHTYSSAGIYTVTLTVTGSDGTDTETKTNYITVTSTIADPDYIWTHRMGGTEWDQADAVCTDANGNVYVAGSFGHLSGTSYTVDFAEDWGGSDTKTDADLGDAFITKIDAQGNYCWTRRIGSEPTNSEEIHAIATDPDGNVYVAGYFGSTVNFAEDWGGNDTKTGGRAFVTKIGANGDYCWTHKVAGASVFSICTYGNDNIYLAGVFGSGNAPPTINFAQDWGGNDSKTTAGDYDVFITKIHTNGDYGWTRRMGGVTRDWANGVCADGNGNIYVTGIVGGGTDKDIFIAKVDASGNFLWTHHMGGSSNDGAYGVCTDANGNVYVSGYFWSSNLNFAQDWGGTDTKSSAALADIFITKIDPNGDYCWTHRMGGSQHDVAYAVCADGGGNVYVTGKFGSYNLNFAEDWGGSDLSTKVGADHVFVTKIDANGSYCRTYTMGGSQTDTANSICTDEAGNIYVAGFFSTEVNFAEDWGGNDTKTSAGTLDIFITKIGPPAGPRNWVQKFPANKPSARENHTMAYDSSRGVVILFGGDGSSGRLDDTWEHNGTDWMQRSLANNPSPREHHSMAYDSARGVVVLFGGRRYSTTDRLDDTWEYGGTNWVQRNPANKPPARQGHSMIYDSGRGVVVLFGGWGGNYFDDTWEYNGTNWVQRSPASKPPVRNGHSMAYNSSRGAVVLFGGWDGGNLLDDTWEYDGTNWAQRSPASKPSAPASHSIAYDSNRGVVVLFGGSFRTSYDDETWEWDGTDWTQRFPTNKPSARRGHSMAYNSGRGVLVLFGGVGSSGRLDDTWEY